MYLRPVMLFLPEAFLHIHVGLCSLLVQTMPSPLQVNFDNWNRGQNADARNDPSNDLDRLDLVAQRHASFNLALEFVQVVGDARVGALDVAPDLVDKYARDDPEDGGDDEENLSREEGGLLVFAVDVSKIEKTCFHTVCIVFIRFLTLLQCVTAYTADRKMVLAQLKMRKPMRASSVVDHHLCVLWR